MLEEMGVLYRGMVLGVMIAAPVGPVGLLCIRRSLQKGALNGLATGVGAALADSLFGAIAVLGVGAILAFIHHYEASIRIIGGIIVLATAIYTWRDHPRPATPTEIVERMLNLTSEKVVLASLRALISGFLITLTNPLTLFGTLAVVATFGELTEGFEAGLMVMGIFSGSVLWWVILSGGINLVREHFTENRVWMINRITAAGLAGLGLWALVKGVGGYLGF